MHNMLIRRLIECVVTLRSFWRAVFALHGTAWLHHSPAGRAPVTACQQLRGLLPRELNETASSRFAGLQLHIITGKERGSRVRAARLAVYSVTVIATYVVRRC